MLLPSNFHQRFQALRKTKTLADDATVHTNASSDSSLSLISLEEGRDESFLEPLMQEDKFPTSVATKSWVEFLLVPSVSKGRFSVPAQLDSRPFLRYLILAPLGTVTSMLFVAYFWVPLLAKQGAFQYLDTTLRDLPPLAIYLLCAPIVLGLIYDIILEATTYIMLIRGRKRRPLPDHIPRLTHAVIICNYKEPLEVLRATVQSLADNTLAQSTMVILACEERDPTAVDVYQALEHEFATSFKTFFKTTHCLAEGEIIGKSSNENHACQELFKVIQEEGLDPFQVMVTTCDADSLFDQVFLEQVEAEFCCMPDGRRFLYNSPINTYRNLPECNALVQSFEVMRCQFDTFNGMTGFRPAQSNYSLTLGFAHEINYWDPSNTSEDFHTTLKAMAMTGLGSAVVVKVWSLILNDSVTGFYDRWVQAKRHMWGVEEVAFVASLFPVLRLGLWSTIFGRVTSQMFGVCTPAILYLLFQPIREVFFSLQWETKCWIVGIYAGSSLYNWTKMVVREVFLYRYILSDRPLMMDRSARVWMQLVLGWSVLSQVSSLLFATIATWRMLFHAVFHDTLAYVTAPKALTVSSSTAAAADSKPKKAI